MGSVRVDSPQLTANTGRLEVWFQQLATTGVDLPSAGNAAAGNAPAGAGPAANPLQKNGPNQQRFDVGGAMIRVLLKMRQQKNAEVSDADIAIEGNAQLRETKTPQPGEQPLSIKGDSVHVAQALSQRAHMAVEGQPAFVEARGMSLSGAKIELEQLNNRLWIDGAGRMTLPDTRTTGKTPATIEVTWQGGMNFDGRTAIYQKSVLARGPHEVLKTDELAVSLKRRIDFIKSTTPQRSSGEKTELEELVCRHGVAFENKAFDERGQASIDRGEARDLVINQTTGVINGTGPGWLTTVRRGMAQSMSGGPSLPGQPAAQPDPDAADRLTFLRVTFERGITGNLTKKEVTFADQVKAIYGPVDTWEQKLEADDPALLGPQGAILTCDQLTVRQMPSAQAKARGSVELEALGNTVVENVSYEAKAHRLTYAEEKDLLILEGNGRSAAELKYQAQKGAPPKTAMAGKIMYWTKTKITNISDAKSVDFGPFSGSLGTKPNKPKK